MTSSRGNWLGCALIALLVFSTHSLGCSSRDESAKKASASSGREGPPAARPTPALSMEQGNVEPSLEPQAVEQPAAQFNGHRMMGAITAAEVEGLLPAPGQATPLGTRIADGTHVIDKYCTSGPDTEVVTAYRAKLEAVGWQDIDSQTYASPKERTVLRAGRGELALRMMITADASGACESGRSIRVSAQKPQSKGPGDMPGRNRGARAGIQKSNSTAPTANPVIPTSEGTK